MRIIALLCAALLAACAGQGGGRLADSPPGLAVADAALASGAPGVALQVCTDTLQREPTNVTAMACQGDSLTALGRRAEAEDVFTRAQALAPDDTRVLMGLGRLRLATDAQAAELLLLRVVTKDQRVAAAWNNLGIARDLQGRHVQAQEAYARAIGLQPDMRAAEVNLALSMAMSGRAGEAVRRLRAIASDPAASPRLRDNLAAVLTLADRPEEAEKLLSRELRPEEVDQAIAGYRALGPSPPAAREPAPPAARPTAPAAAPPPSPVSPSPAPPSPAPLPKPGASAAPAVAPVRPLAAAPRADGIVLHATADTWAHVTEPHGRVLLNRLMHAGESWPVPADAPAGLLLTTGNAGGLELSIDGAPARSLGRSGTVLHRVPLDAAALREARAGARAVTSAD